MQRFSFLTTMDNWTGHSASIVGEVFAGQPEWWQNGHKVQLRSRRHYDDWVQWEVWVDDERQDITVGKADSDEMWEAISADGDFSRQASDKANGGQGAVAAVAKYLFNTL